MPLSREEAATHLAHLEHSIEELAAVYQENAFLVEAIASAGEDIADQAGLDRLWVEDQVVAILVRHGMVMPAGAQDEADE